MVLSPRRWRLTVLQGSWLSWAIYQKRTALAWVRRHIDTALALYLAVAKDVTLG